MIGCVDPEQGASRGQQQQINILFICGPHSDLNIYILNIHLWYFAGPLIHFDLQKCLMSVSTDK